MVAHVYGRLVICSIRSIQHFNQSLKFKYVVTCTAYVSARVYFWQRSDCHCRMNGAVRIRIAVCRRCKQATCCVVSFCQNGVACFRYGRQKVLTNWSISSGISGLSRNPPQQVEWKNHPFLKEQQGKIKYLYTYIGGICFFLCFVIPSRKKVQHWWYPKNNHVKWQETPCHNHSTRSRRRHRHTHTARDDYPIIHYYSFKIYIHVYIPRTFCASSNPRRFRCQLPIVPDSHDCANAVVVKRSRRTIYPNPLHAPPTWIQNKMLRICHSRAI